MRADKVNTGGAILIFMGTFARIYRRWGVPIVGMLPVLSSFYIVLVAG